MNSSGCEFVRVLIRPGVNLPGYEFIIKTLAVTGSLSVHASHCVIVAPVKGRCRVNYGRGSGPRLTGSKSFDRQETRGTHPYYLCNV